MANCPKCHTQNDSHSKFCIACGTPLNQGGVQPATQPVHSACPNCHAELHPSDKFCIQCGTPVTASLSNNLHAQPQHHAHQPQTYYPPAPKKSPLPLIIGLVALVLVLAGGGFWIYKSMSKPVAQPTPPANTNTGTGTTTGKSTPIPTPQNANQKIDVANKPTQVSNLNYFYHTWVLSEAKLDLSTNMVYQTKPGEWVGAIAIGADKSFAFSQSGQLDEMGTWKATGDSTYPIQIVSEGTYMKVEPTTITDGTAGIIIWIDDSNAFLGMLYE
ncbi:zinc ribbon domain-containing protein [Tumebacillus flagellatus]|uniref:RanBP2-type domain-containing protein n=1 Tax=Tumebacillus flagellatus TaxID=1157490 RepID=A0A074LL93_9BACL|nr:zinc ribbon domain-containing protein [Tumebacillus flagellatus]KEO81340.1 hypothetical protein EL26_21115 [Tumebacillus flagellatus]